MPTTITREMIRAVRARVNGRAPGPELDQVVNAGGLPCVHRRPATGERVPCASCPSGRTSFKVYGCKKHGLCVIGEGAPLLMACSSCEYRLTPNDEQSGLTVNT